MPVECVLYGRFRERAGQRQLRLAAETVGDGLEGLEAEHPELEGELRDERVLVGATVITKNGTDIRHLAGLDTRLEDGDVLRLVPSVSSG